MQQKIVLYNDGISADFITPYTNIYEPNIKPRTSAQSPDPQWQINYGGKVLLSAKTEYHFEGHSSSASSVRDYGSANLGTPFSSTQYIYDNLSNSIRPTRIIQKDSKGDSYTTVTRTVAEMDVPGVVANMKAQNMLSPVVKQQTLKNGRLLEEVVNEYNPASSCFVLSGQKRYTPLSEILVSSFLALDSTAFSYDQALYEKEKSVGYAYHSGAYRPNRISDKSETTSIIYNFDFDVPILKARNYDPKNISAVNMFSNGPTSNWYSLKRYWNQFFAFKKVLEKYFENPNHPNFSPEHLYHPDYENIKKLIMAIVSKSYNITYSEYEQELDQFFTTSSDKTLYEYCQLFNVPHEDYRTVEDVLYYTLKARMIYETLYEQLNKCKFIASEDSPLPSDADDVDLDMVMKGTQSLTSVPASKLKIYILSNQFAGTVSYRVSYAGRPSSQNVRVASKNHWNVQTATIDLSAYNGVYSIEISNLVSTKVNYIAIVPEDCEFEATSYGSDGMEFCKFDHNGRMELYERDGAGRIIKIWDQNGDLLKEYTYNLPTNL